MNCSLNQNIKHLLLCVRLSWASISINRYILFLLIFISNPLIWYLLLIFFSFAFNTSNVYAFAFALLCQEGFALLITVLFAIDIVLFVSLCWFFEACVVDIQQMFLKIDETTVKGTKKLYQLDIKRMLVDVMELHIWSARYF